LNLDGRTFMNLTSLADSFQLVAYDLPESTPFYKGNFDDFMLIIDDFVNRLGIHDCCIVGVSFGGGIALNLAAHHPGIQARRLILVSTGIVGTTKAERSQQNAMGDWIEKLPDYKVYWLMEKILKRSQKSSKDTLLALQPLMRMKHPGFYRQVALSMRAYDIVPAAKSISCPVLVIYGTEDEVFTQEQSARIGEIIPQAENHQIPGGRHSMIFTEGKEISGIIRSFCDRHPLAP